MKADSEHPTSYVTGFVDFERHVIVDVIWGNWAIDVKRLLAGRDKAFLQVVRVVAGDFHEGYRSGLHLHLDYVRKVADPFHVATTTNRCVDEVRRRVQNQELSTI